ncbi:diaminopropionate ammonia-lyase [Anaerosphaera aminiphila DSM 21120]|uniref:Diaminopropionate ammonia-lyase n=1 Tax=Anaerosphaera aminiphila DSM 21120 TaxID=1120995 RepID=A0A1M5QTA3_9FIRM|nr:diaminopropionate ammonia-lyase [Anaerosphaera aminiphila DSM 21120]
MGKMNITSLGNKIKNEDISFLNRDVAEKVKGFHSSFPQYSQTPLVELKNLSEHLGINNMFIKDESYRFDLNAFKVLGASFAVGNFIANKLDIDIAKLPYSVMTSDEVKAKLGDLTFVTATDGNHGRGLAWTANQLGQKSKVFMPKGTAIERVENIRKENSDVDVYDANYDECVRMANDYANTHGGIMVQDTSWDGYEDIPRWIMQGYMTMANEAYEQLNSSGQRPTHIFLQAGVGSLASAVTGFFANVYSDNIPTIVIVEPEKANCLYQTAKADDGKIHNVDGDLDTIMAGLACGEPVTIGWPILNSYASYFLSVDEIYASHGMRLLGNPKKDDKRVISGESGAVTSGVVSKLMTDSELADIKNEIGLDENSVVLVFSTEGDTDKKMYRDIVWDGRYPSY